MPLWLLPKPPAPSHKTYTIYRLGSPHNFRQKDEGDENKTLRGNTSVAEFAHHQLANKVLVQGQAAQFLKPDNPFLYLGVHITMDLNRTHQLAHMTTKLSLDLERLKNPFASSKQTMDIIHTAIVPSMHSLLFSSYPLLPKRPKSMGHTNSGSHKKQV